MTAGELRESKAASDAVRGGRHADADTVVRAWRTAGSVDRAAIRHLWPELAAALDMLADGRP
jgi:hypothetical protein